MKGGENMNEDRWYDRGAYEDDPEILGECGCGKDIVEGYDYIEVEGEYFCDSTCAVDYFVLANCHVEENNGQHPENTNLGTCPCGSTINSDYEYYLVEDEYYCDSCCIFEHYIEKNHVVR